MSKFVNSYFTTHATVKARVSIKVTEESNPQLYRKMSLEFEALKKSSKTAGVEHLEYAKHGRLFDFGIDTLDITSPECSIDYDPVNVDLHSISWETLDAVPDEVTGSINPLMFVEFGRNDIRVSDY